MGLCFSVHLASQTSAEPALTKRLTVPFPSFQLSAGRLADLWSAGWVFIFGIGTVAVLNLVLSFRKSIDGPELPGATKTHSTNWHCSKQPYRLPRSACFARRSGCHDDT